jgi:hypothetical protein
MSRKMSFFKFVLLTLVMLTTMANPSKAAWGFGSSDPGKVLLRDVQVLTLYDGKMTTGTRFKISGREY